MRRYDYIREMSMLDWMKWGGRRGSNMAEPERDAKSPEPQRSVISGKYHELHKYLANRYADTVVLTFADIEDLLGFSLPNLARVRPEWWTDADPASAPSGHTDAWRLAHRTARPNLLAQIVVFERAS
jgi:hypothetical protein